MSLPSIERTKDAGTVATYLANCLDAWHTAHPDLTVQEILNGLEELRHKLTEGLIEALRENDG
jgi:hypothetical protein